MASGLRNIALRVTLPNSAWDPLSWTVSLAVSGVRVGPCSSCVLQVGTWPRPSWEHRALHTRTAHNLESWGPSLTTPRLCQLYTSPPFHHLASESSLTLPRPVGGRGIHLHGYEKRGGEEKRGDEAPDMLLNYCRCPFGPATGQHQREEASLPFLLPCGC